MGKKDKYDQTLEVFSGILDFLLLMTMLPYIYGYDHNSGSDVRGAEGMKCSRRIEESKTVRMLIEARYDQKTRKSIESR